jgi:tRNA-dihydrouridine synthase
MSTIAPEAPVVPELSIGPHRIGTPVVLAPMAGITNAAFRQLCRELATEALAREGVHDVPILPVERQLHLRLVVLEILGAHRPTSVISS